MDTGLTAARPWATLPFVNRLGGKDREIGTAMVDALEILPLATPELGDTTWLLARDGLAVVVDPQRDCARFAAAAADRGLEVRAVVETHVHNDYVSGAPLLAEATGAELIVPAASGAWYPHRPAHHREPIVLGGGLALVPLHTPGHTPEHTSYVVRVDGRDVAVFSGGSLLFGAAGRTDLLGDGPARRLAIAQHASLRRLAALPDDVTLHPTHGQGSFCSTGTATRTASTIGIERREHPLLAESDPERAADAQLGPLGPYPAYYRHMRGRNLAGAAGMSPPAPALPAAAVADLAASGVTVVDGRPRAAYAGAHLPGAVGVELGPSFATWVGWLVPFDAPLVLVLDPDQDAAGAQVALARIGFDRVRGVLRGIDAWCADGRPVRSFPLVGAPALTAALAEGRARQVLDVRAPAEWAAGHLPGAAHRHLPDLLGGVGDLFDPAEDVWVACASGLRATAAGGLLQEQGFSPTVVGLGGVPDVLAGAA